uniref:Cytochrome P450, family 2, subfamily K, polypeptide16 n=1 Tax=Cyprinus carpio TaxID=7962 RepID=A0A8C2JYF7_CYPCA
MGSLWTDSLLQSASSGQLMNYSLSHSLMAKQFGPVFTVYFGPKKVVVLAGYKTVKQALINHADEFGDREIMPLFHDLTKGHGKITPVGFFILINFGMGKKKIEEKIIEETCHLLEEACSFVGKPFETTRLMNYAASSVISSIVYGRRFEYTDPQHLLMFVVQLYNKFPFLGPWLKNLKLIMNNLALDIKEISELVSSLHQTLNSQDLRGFVDSFLVRMIEILKPLKEYSGFIMHDQTKTLKPINSPMSIPHMTSCDVHFNGYFIKKGTCVFPLLMSVLWDEDEWETPQNFNPQHFLDKQRRFVKRDAFMPFSAGRRACLGESLARMELFLFFTFLLQHFSFTPPPGVSGDELDLTSAVGFTLNPTPHKLCAVKRTLLQ